MTLNKKKYLQKKTLHLLTAGLFSAIVIIVLDFLSKPIRHNPYPFEIHSKLISKVELESALNCHVLFIGDRMGLALNRYLPSLEEKISSRLQDPILLHNWSVEHEGLHRTLWRLKQLPKFPKIIVYHGGTEEFHETLWSFKDQANIIHDFNLFTHPWWGTLLKLVPSSSKILLRNKNIKTLSDLPPSPAEIPPVYATNILEMNYRLYEHELDELISLSRRNKTDLIFITAPLNLDLAPDKTCPQSTTPELDNFLLENMDAMEKGHYKVAFGRLKALSEQTIGNAQTYHLLSQSAKKLGLIATAKQKAIEANSYDCSPRYASSVINSIIRQKAQEENLPIIDFDRMVNEEWGQNTLFSNDIYPQNIFYENLIEKITQTLIKLLNL